MDIVYAAEKPSIADLIEDHVRQSVTPDELEIVENPDETGSFYVGWRRETFVLSPAGEVASDSRKSGLIR